MFDRKAYIKEYRKTPQYKSIKKAYMKKYRQTPQYKAAQEVYMKSYVRTDQFKTYLKKYKKTEKGKFASSNAYHRRRSTMKNTDITSKWLQDLKHSSINCPLCGDVMNEVYHDPKSKNLDHIVPLNKKCGGLHMMNNVRYICQDCNLTRPRDGSDIKEKVLQEAL